MGDGFVCDTQSIRDDALLLASATVTLTLVLSGVHILRHCLYNDHPALQKYAIRVRDPSQSISCNTLTAGGCTWCR